METQFDLLLGLGEETLLAMGSRLYGGQKWATFLPQQGVSSPGWARWGKGRHHEIWPEVPCPWRDLKTVTILFISASEAVHCML